MSIWQITAILIIVALGIPAFRSFYVEALEWSSELMMLSMMSLPAVVVTAGPLLQGVNGGWALIFYAIAPFLLAHYIRNDWTIILAVWLPVEFGWVTRVNNAPEPAIVGLLVLLLIYVVGYANRKAVVAMGYTFILTASNVKNALKGLVIILLIALPLALYLEFVSWPPRWLPFEQIAPRFGVIYIVALAEEVLFRGLIQNSIESWVGRNNLSLGISAAIFGAAHLNNGVEYLYWNNLNWEYAVLATVAGVVYGLVWRWSGRVTVSALTHAMVNLVRVLL